MLRRRPYLIAVIERRKSSLWTLSRWPRPNVRQAKERSCLIGTTRWSIHQKRMAQFTQRAGQSADWPLWPWSSRYGYSRSSDDGGTIHGRAACTRLRSAVSSVRGYRLELTPPLSVVLLAAPACPHAGAVSFDANLVGVGRSVPVAGLAWGWKHHSAPSA